MARLSHQTRRLNSRGSRFAEGLTDPKCKPSAVDKGWPVEMHRLANTCRGRGTRNRRSGLTSRWWTLIGTLLLLAAFGWIGKWHHGPIAPHYDAPLELTASEAGHSTETSSNPSEVLPELPKQTRRAWQEIDSPANDGWSTEVVSEELSAALKQLGKLLTHGKQIDAERVQFLADPDFACDPLMPTHLQTVFQDKTVLVERARLDEAEDEAETHLDKKGNGPEEDGPSRLASALRSVAAPFADSENVRFKFKLFFIRTTKKAIETRQYLAISGHTPSGQLELNATWNIRWAMPAQRAADPNESSAPRIQWIGVEQYEQVRTRPDGAAWFSDCTESVLGHNNSYHDQLLLGMNHWLERIQDTRYFSSLGNPGLAVGDVNGDGLDDLYVCQEAQLPNRLYLQQPDGTAVDVSKEWGIDWLDNSRSALLLDLDNDGDQDLVVAIPGGLVVAANENNSRFEIRTVLPTDDDTMSLSAVDYDLDGDLDLYVCVDYANDFFAKDRSLAVVGGASNRVYHDSNNAGRNSLFRNDIDRADKWQFSDVTKQVGLDENNHRFSLAASWEDFDNDGDQDLYVANDFGRNNLYRNDARSTDQRTFVDVARAATTEDSASGMSAAWGDYDRDGMMDVYVGNMFSAAGGRITNQAMFKQDATERVKSRLRRFARGSTLLRNQGDGLFSDLSEEAAVTVGRWAWGSNFVDLNNDGWLDIVVANGYITADDTGDL